MPFKITAKEKALIMERRKVKAGRGYNPMDDESGLYSESYDELYLSLSKILSADKNLRQPILDAEEWIESVPEFNNTIKKNFKKSLAGLKKAFLELRKQAVYHMNF